MWTIRKLIATIRKYTWARFKGFNGEDGLPGINGEDGKTSYLHIKYSDNGGLSFTANNGEEPGAYIGQYVDFIQKDSDNPTDYTWSLIKGESGTAGSDATTGEYYEYRYAKNGSTVSPPALDADAENPAGWSTTMPTVGTLEYLWCTMAKKSGLSDKKVFDIPVQQGETTLLDITGHGVSGALKMVLPLCKTVADMPLILATMRSVRLIGIFRLVKVSRSVFG